MHEDYDTAQICLNGHVVSDVVLSNPQFRQAYCGKCGERTITECLECNAPIRGRYHIPNLVGFYEYNLPHFCQNCGHAFPWTERLLEAATQLANNEESLSEGEKSDFAMSIKEIVRETPIAKVSANRLHALLGKMATRTASAIRDIIVDIASESAKKMIWPND